MKKINIVNTQLEVSWETLREVIDESPDCRVTMYYIGSNGGHETAFKYKGRDFYAKILKGIITIRYAGDEGDEWTLINLNEFLGRGLGLVGFPYARGDIGQPLAEVTYLIKDGIKNRLNIVNNKIIV